MERAVCCGPDTREDILKDTAEFDCMHDNIVSDDVFFPQLLRFVYFFGGAKILIQLEDVDTF